MFWPRKQSPSDSLSFVSPVAVFSQLADLRCQMNAKRRLWFLESSDDMATPPPAAKAPAEPGANHGYQTDVAASSATATAVTAQVLVASNIKTSNRERVAVACVRTLQRLFRGQPWPSRKKELLAFLFCRHVESAACRS